MAERRARFADGELPWAVLGLAMVLVACPAPSSRPAGGAVGTAVETALQAGTESFEHSAWSALLAAGTHDGLADYETLAARRPELDGYLDSVAAAELDSLEPSHLKALLINAYNAYTVVSILDHPEVSSIRDIAGVWDTRRHTVGGFELTLDEIEHNLLRPYFRDPRIHFVVNCASRSCAPLPPWAYSGEELEAEIETQSAAFLRDAANVRLEGGRLLLSRYFDWYGADFTESGWEPRADSIPAFVALYAETEAAEAIATDPALEIAFLDYDWDLNTAKRPR